MVKSWDVTIPKLSGAAQRKVYLYLPEDYDGDSLRRYPVLYMFDGHNIFYDSEAAFGKSWNLTSYLLWTRKNLIVVAVECNKKGNNRLKEYSPTSFTDPKYGTIRGRGRSYMDWLVKELKPYIDENYRTLPDREYTAIAGSSMGGLMSLYAVTAYNRYFSRAACLSPSLWTNPERLLEMVGKAKLAKDTTIYMDYGSEELANHPVQKEILGDMSQLLLKKNVNLAFRIIPGGNHSEASWEKQIPIFMDCLGL